MKKTLLTLIGLAAFSLAGGYAAAFTPGNIIVGRLGDGNTTLTSSATSISLLEFSPFGGAASQTLSTQFAGENLQTDSGSATSNGYISFGGGKYLAVSGHNATLGTASVASSNNKVAQIIDVTTGNVVSRVAFPTGGPSGTPQSPYSGNNFRSIIPIGQNAFYTGGTSSGSPNTGGVWHYDGSAFTQISNTAQLSNVRNVEVYAGQLYVSSSSGAFLGISSVGSGLSTSANQTTTLQINMGTGASPYGFVLFDTNNDSQTDTAFIADDRTATGGGLNKYTFDGSTWTKQYSLLLSSTNSTFSSTAATGFAGIRGLAGSYDSATGFSLFATTAETSNNRLVQISDNGTTPTAFATLGSAGTNYVFRGLDVVPVPEPSTWALIGLGSAFLLWRIRRKNSAV
jgi:hypothetical protein